MRLPIAAIAVLAALTVAGCEASVSTGDDKTLDKADIAFTFDYPGDWSEKKVDVATTKGKVRALVGIDENNLIAVRQFAPKASTTADTKAATVSFATQNGVPASAVTVAKHAGIEMAQFDTATTVDGTATANSEYVFPAGGATWQLECQSTPDHTDDVRKACDMALDTIKVK